MKRTISVAAKLLLLAVSGSFAQGNSFAGNKQLQLSLHSGLSSFTTKTSLDSVYFLKAGYHAAVQGNYYWKNFGLAARAGYFANGADKQSLEDFARKRRAPRDRTEINTGAYRSMYLFTGPAFKSGFNRWQLESTLEGGLINKPASQILIGDNVSPDIVYYRNVFDASSSFAWAAGLSISYALTTQFLLGVNADYLNTRNDVVNYDIQRGNGREAKNISSAAGFLNTGVRLSYLFNRQSPRDAASGQASGKRQMNTDENNSIKDIAINNAKEQPRQNNDTCKCENKIMEVQEMVPYVVEIQFATVAEAKKFLDTYEPLLERRDVQTGQASGKRQHMKMSNAQSNPLYQQTGHAGDNPLYQGKRETISNTQGTRGVVQRNALGDQVFYTIPSSVDLAEVLSFEEGRVTVHVQNNSNGNDADMATRDRATGQSSGKRQYKALAVGDLDGDGVNDTELRSFSHEVKSPRDVATGQSSGKRAKVDAFTIKQGIVIEADLDGDGEFEPLAHVKSPRDVATGQASGKRTMAKEDVYVWKIKYAGDVDGDGIEDGFILSGLNKDAPSMPKTSFAILLNSGEEAMKVVEKATSGIKQTMQTQVLVTNNDNNDSGNENAQKAGISTSRSNIRTKSITSCADGSCAINCEIELDGKVYQAQITLKTRHDTVKNSIGNIR